MYYHIEIVLLAFVPQILTKPALGSGAYPGGGGFGCSNTPSTFSSGLSKVQSTGRSTSLQIIPGIAPALNTSLLTILDTPPGADVRYMSKLFIYLPDLLTMLFGWSFNCLPYCYLLNPVRTVFVTMSFIKFIFYSLIFIRAPSYLQK